MSYEKLTLPRYNDVASFAWADRLSDAQDDLYLDKPSCRVYRNAVTTCTTSGTTYVLSFNAVRWDNGAGTGCWTALDPTVLRAPRDGLYVVSASIDWDANTTGYRYLSIGDANNDPTQGSIFNTNTTTAPSTTAGAYYCSQTLTTLLVLEQDQKFSIHVKQTSGGSLNVVAGSATAQTHDAMMQWIGYA